MLKAKVVKFNYIGLGIDGLLLPNGSYRIAVTQIAKLLFPTTPQNATKFVKAALGDSLLTSPIQKIPSELSTQDVNTVTFEQFLEVCLFYYHKKQKAIYLKTAIAVSTHLGLDTEALEALKTHSKRKKPRKACKRDEREIQLAYQARYGGEIEVITPLGRIDLLTDACLYEFKYYRGFKEAFGQVICYSQFEPRLERLIVLYGCPRHFEGNHSIFKSLCKDYGIKVKYLI